MTVQQQRPTMPSREMSDPESPLDAAALRERFPILRRRAGQPYVVYLDSAATTQKPDIVLDAVANYYETSNANVHRGVHQLSVKATNAFEAARDRVRRFVNATDVREVIFTRGTTEAVNLVAQTYARPRLDAGDEILITNLEHHSNIVPWQIVCEQTGARLRVAPVDDRGEIIVEAFGDLLNERTKLAAFGHVSNALGTVNPIRELVAMCRDNGTATMIDGAQATAHGGVDVQEIGCDFYALSGHKMYAPMGIGCLIGRREVLESMPPYQGGGDMIASVSFDGTTYNELPFKFEAGTPNVGGAIGLAAAIEFLDSIGADRIIVHEQKLLRHAESALREISGLRIIGEPTRRSGAISFVIEGAHPHDIGTVVDAQGVAIRTGHHCAQPLMDRFDITATARLSVGVYNTIEDIDALTVALREVAEVFG